MLSEYWCLTFYTGYLTEYPNIPCPFYYFVFVANYRWRSDDVYRASFCLSNVESVPMELTNFTLFYINFVAFVVLIFPGKDSGWIPVAFPRVSSLRNCFKLAGLALIWGRPSYRLANHPPQSIWRETSDWVYKVLTHLKLWYFFL